VPAFHSWHTYLQAAVAATLLANDLLGTSSGMSCCHELSVLRLRLLLLLGLVACRGSVGAQTQGTTDLWTRKGAAQILLGSVNLCWQHAEALLRYRLGNRRSVITADLVWLPVHLLF